MLIATNKWHSQFDKIWHSQYQRNWRSECSLCDLCLVGQISIMWLGALLSLFIANIEMVGGKNGWTVLLPEIAKSDRLVSMT